MARAALKNDDCGTVLNDMIDQGKVLRLFADRIDHAAAEVSALSAYRDQTFARSFVYSLETASLFERVDETPPDFGGDNVQVLGSRDGWRTYNFEVEDLHTYIAGNFRVHNDSAATLVVADAAYKNLFGSEFDTTPESLDKLMGALSDGSIQAYGEYTALLSDDRYTTVAYDGLKDKIVMTIEKGEWNVTTWRDGLRLETRTIDPATGKAVMVHVGGMTTKLGDGAAGKSVIALTEKQQIDYIITEALGKLNYAGAVAALGSSIGNAIAGDNFAAKIATSSLLSTFLSKFAASLGAGPGGAQTVSIIGENGAVNITQIVDATFKDFNVNLAGNIRSQMVGAMSSILMGELSEALGLNGVTKGIFNTVAGTTVSTIGDVIIKNIATMIEKNVFNSADLFAGLTTGNIAAQINGAIHSYLGSELGQALVVTKTPEATLFASATASILSTLLSSFGPIGNFVGSAVGRAIGGIVGREIFDNDMNVSILVDVDKLAGALKSGASITVDATNNEKQLGKDLANRVIDDINKFIVENKFHIDTDAVYKAVEVGLFADFHNVRRLKADGVPIGTLDQNEEVNKQSIMQALYKAEGAVFKNLSLLIEDPLIRRAYYAGHEDGVAQMSLDIKVAQDYLKYLEDAAAINAVMRQDMSSKFSVGWSLTLLRARELGLDQVSASDFHGGFYVNLKGHDVVQGPRGAAAGFAPERMAWTPDFEASDLSAGYTNSGSLLLRSPDKLSTVTVENVFAPGKLTSITGASDTATVDGRKASSSESSLVFVKAGDGDKTVYGSEKWGSILVGGTGKQTLIGGAGNDWLRAGDNNVALIGGDGDDLLVAGVGSPLMDGGKGRNTYILGLDGADVRISAIDPNGSDMIVAVTAGARSENNIIDITARSGDGHAVYSSKTGISPHEAKSSFSRSGTDLVISTVSGEVRLVSNTDENGNVISSEQQYTADAAKGKIVVKNFFLTDSGIDTIKFSDGTSFTNSEIWNQAKVTVRIDDNLWNSNDSTSTNTIIDTTNVQANFLAQQTTTYNGNNVFIAYFSDDGTMWTNSFDALAHHDWQKWETAYKADGTISTEAVTFDVKDASGNFIKIFRGAGGMVAGGVGDDVLRSAIAGSTLIGDRGNDDLSGSGGSDLLYGGSGDDRYTVGTGDQVFEFAGQGNDIVETTVSYALAAGQEIEELRLADPADPAGTTALNLSGNDKNNTLVGNAAANTLDGGAGNDVLRGGLGNDIYVVDATGDTVTENAGEGSDGVRTSLGSYVLGAEIENLRYTGSGAFIGTGNALANTLTGAAGDDTLNGGDGNDILRGGDGDDTYRVNTASDQVFEAVGQGNDTVLSDNSFTLQAGQEIETLRFANSGSLNNSGLAGNEFANTLIGNAGANNLFGNGGNDSLDGGAGNDVLRGGAGDDTYRVDNANDQVFEADGEGRDTILSDNSFTLAAGQEIEILRLAMPTGTVGRGLAGNEFDNTLIGNAGDNYLGGGGGNDLLDGGDGGADTINGGDGTDTVSYASSSRKVTIALNDGATWDGEKGDTLTSVENATGSAFNDTLVGDANANVLDGAAGADAMRGGLGNDIYIVDATGDTVTENAGEGTDGVRTTLTSYTLGAEIENLRYIGGAAFTGTGNALANAVTGAGADDTLNGGAGNDVLNGLGGDDKLTGGTGNDIYVVDSTGDTVTEAAGAGTDELQTNLASYNLGAEVEILRYIGSAAFTGTGNALDNTLYGRAGDDNLNGGAGDDVLRGGEGDDTYRVDGAGDQVFEVTGEGRDTILSDNSFGLAAGQEIEVLQLTFATSTTARSLSGNEFANTLIGNAGSNGLNGGAGNDVLTGNAGSDTFQFRAALGSTNVDRITDFSSDDSIVLDNAYMAGLSTGTLASGAFKNISQTAADADDRILYKQATGELFYDADGSGSGAAVRFAILDNKAALSYQDFLVV